VILHNYVWTYLFLKIGSSEWLLKLIFLDLDVQSTELGSPTTANFCFFRWKMTNILSESNWNQRTCFFHLFPSLDLTVRATAHQKTWHFKENSQKNQKIVNQERWKQLLMKCKGIMYRCRVFYLDSTFKSIYNKEIFI